MSYIKYFASFFDNSLKVVGLSCVVFGLPYDLWEFRKEMKLPLAQLREKEGKYAAGKVKGSFQVKDGQLYEILSNGLELPLLAENEDNFIF